MSGWDQWAVQLTANGANLCGAIIAKDGKSVWGKAGNFSLSAYQTKIPDGQGGQKSVNVDEGARIVQALAAKGMPSKEMTNNGGLFINKTKYRVVRYIDDLDALYLKGPGTTGACLQSSTQAIVFCAYDKSQGKQNAGDCNMAVEKLVAALKGSGY